MLSGNHVCPFEIWNRIQFLSMRHFGITLTQGTLSACADLQRVLSKEGLRASIRQVIVPFNLYFDTNFQSPIRVFGRECPESQLMSFSLKQSVSSLQVPIWWSAFTSYTNGIRGTPLSSDLWRLFIIACFVVCPHVLLSTCLTTQSKERVCSFMHFWCIPHLVFSVHATVCTVAHAR